MDGADWGGSLREVCGGDIIICNGALYDGFVDFTKALVIRACRLLKKLSF